MCRNRFGGGFEPVVRRSTEWMNEFSHAVYFAHVTLTYDPTGM